MEQRENKMEKKTDIYILSGFLGSGKTTLLTELLSFEKEKDRKVAVLMNELGKVSIDSAAVDHTTPLKELLDGCICCSLQGQFEEQLQELLQEHTLDAIYIETTGAAHPFEVYDGCLSPLFADKIEIKGIITMVDLVRWKERDRLSDSVFQLITEQIRFSDFIILNKMDLVSEADQVSLLFPIQSLNPPAKMLLTSYARINPEEIVNMKPVSDRKQRSLPLTGNQHKLAAYVHTFTKPVSQHAFEAFIKQLPASIYRMKGFLRFTHTSGVYSFQFTNGQMLLLPEASDQKLNFVIIGEDVNEQWLNEQLMLIET